MRRCVCLMMMMMIMLMAIEVSFKNIIKIQNYNENPKHEVHSDNSFRLINFVVFMNPHISRYYKQAVCSNH